MTATPLAQWAQELPKDREAESGRLADQFVGLTAYDIGVAESSVSSEIFQVFGQVQPAVDQPFVQFQVALQGV